MFKIKKFIKIFTMFLTVLSVFTFSIIYYCDGKISEEYTLLKENDIKFNSNLPIKIKYETESLQNVSNSKKSTERFIANFKLFGLIPVKSANVILTPETYVDVLGTPFGIKLYTDGVLVVNLTEFESNGNRVCPAKESGIRKGDYIISVNGKRVFTNSDTEKIVNSWDGEPIKVAYYRNGKEYTTNVMPKVSSTDGKYHLGMWLRDSAAGIGTLTFYDPNSKVVAGLGHALCDSQTGKMMSVNSGCIVDAEIIDIEKSTNGFTGELIGRFNGKSISNALMNCENGIYANLNSVDEVFATLPVASKLRITEGEAQILVTIDENGARLYKCEIIEVYDSQTNSKNFVIQVTDKTLISKTGGIVPGMSGSPIIQNGKLIGAVTHVFIDDPTKGYAIFAENMLKTVQSVAEEYLKEAS